MPGPFDTTLKYLMQTYPADWLSFLGIDSHGPVEVVDANLSTVTAEVDKLFHVNDGGERLVHLEFQSSYDPTMGRRLLRYNAMLHEDRGLPIESILMLLRPSADGPAITGEYRVTISGRAPHVTFTYETRRIWLEPAVDLLHGALGTLPLVPLGSVSQADLRPLLRAVEDRLTQEATTVDANQLRVVTYTLLGLRYPPSVADQLMPGIRNVRDSSTYMAIVEEGLTRGRVEGRVEEARELLLALGERRFGSPDQRTRDTLAEIDDHDLLHALVTRLLDAASWEALLATR